MKRYQLENILSWLLIVLGSASVLLAIMDTLGLEITMIAPKGTAGITLALLGLLATAIGIERYFTIGRLQDGLNDLSSNVDKFPSIVAENIDSVQARLGSVAGGRYVNGSKHIYDVLELAAERATKHVRALIVGDGKRSPESLAEALANRIHQLIAEERPVQFDTVLVLPQGAPLAVDFLDFVQKRNAVYRRYGVADCVHLYVLELEPYLTFDVYIVDRNDVVVAFSHLLSSNEMHGAIAFEGKPEIADDFIDWYSEVLNKATPFDQWLAKHVSNDHK